MHGLHVIGCHATESNPNLDSLAVQKAGGSNVSEDPSSSNQPASDAAALLAQALQSSTSGLPSLAHHPTLPPIFVHYYHWHCNVLDKHLRTCYLIPRLRHNLA